MSCRISLRLLRCFPIEIPGRCFLCRGLPCRLKKPLRQRLSSKSRDSLSFMAFIHFNLFVAHAKIHIFLMISDVSRLLVGRMTCIASI